MFIFISSSLTTAQIKSVLFLFCNIYIISLFINDEQLLSNVTVFKTNVVETRIQHIDSTV